jgi:hypothetical protein
MWLPNDFPTEKVQAALGFAPDTAWLDHGRAAAIRLANGCSASIVSGQGLVATNHHCVEDCLSGLSSAEHDYQALGFLAAKPEEERRCPGMEADRLVEITPVSDRIAAATKGKTGAAFAAALKQEEATITRECAGGDAAIRCDIVTLYEGGRYDLYKYRRFQDVRLVFAPEDAIGSFGGDPDNFQFPRYDLDVGFVRIWEGGKPLVSGSDHLVFSAREPVAGEPTFVIGNPGRTHRGLTVAELEAQRSVDIPREALYVAEERGALKEFSRRGTEEARTASSDLDGVENTLKVMHGLWTQLADPGFFDAKRGAEQALRAKVAADPVLQAEAGSAWDDIAAAAVRHRAVSDKDFLLDHVLFWTSASLADALNLVRAPVERAKPDGERLAEFTDAQMPATREDLLSSAALPAPRETLELAFWLSKLRELLGPDDALVHDLLGTRSPQDLAAELIKGSKIAEPAERKRLLDGGQPAIDASKDPLILFARKLDPAARAVRKQVEDDWDAVRADAGGRIERAAFKLYGRGRYPDATFSMRISYGSVRGWTRADGVTIPPFTRIEGMYRRATGSDPFKLPQNWLAAKGAVDGNRIYNFVTNNDIVGGNSGSPVLDAKGEVIGLAFDGNDESIGGDYVYDGKLNRCVVVSSASILEALGKVYHASRLLAELQAG